MRRIDARQMSIEDKQKELRTMVEKLNSTQLNPTDLREVQTKLSEINAEIRRNVFSMVNVLKDVQKESNSRIKETCTESHRLSNS